MTEATGLIAGQKLVIPHGYSAHPSAHSRSQHDSCDDYPNDNQDDDDHAALPFSNALGALDRLLDVGVSVSNVVRG